MQTRPLPRLAERVADSDEPIARAFQAAKAADLAGMAAGLQADWQKLADLQINAPKTPTADQIDADIAVYVRDLNDTERSEYQTRALQILADIYGRRKAKGHDDDDEAASTVRADP